MKAYTVFSTHSLLESFDSYQSFLYRQDPNKFFKLIFNSYENFSENGPDKNPLIITDSVGKNQVLNYTRISEKCIVDILSYIDKKFWETWTLSKLLATEYMAKNYENIIYFNYDIILKNKIPEDFLQKEVFALKNEDLVSAENWGYKKYIKYLETNSTIKSNKNIYNMFKNINIYKDKIFINTDIFAARNISLINKYISIAKENIFDRSNEKFWLNKDIIKNKYGKACLLDQFLFALIILNEGKEIHLLEESLFLNDFNLNIIGPEKIYYFN